mgnify:FL=1|tara:strand:- start:296 stop:1078 length:783 start_codon:yes stop_codon:yes gene_type:complete
MKKQPRIIVWDIETSFMIVKSFGLWNQNHSHKNIVNDWYIICICWKVLGKSKVHTLSLDFKNSITSDYELVKAMRDVLVGCDILIHHNGNAFDLKKFNSRLIYHGFDPIPPIVCIDTLKEVRKIAKFSSNRLDYLGTHLGLGSKLETGGHGLWDGVMDGDPKALKLMVKYCIQDIILLEKIYYKLRGYMKVHPNVTSNKKSKYGLHGIQCPKCGSWKNNKTRVMRAASGKVHQQYKCQGENCHSYFQLLKADPKKIITKI